MIDDVWITQHVPLGQTLIAPAESECVQRKLSVDPRNGKKVETTVSYEGFTTVLVTMETRTIAIRLSVPRMSGQSYNFPLRELPLGVGSMDLETPGAFLERLTGWASFPSLQSWPVTRVSYDLDVHVGAGNVRATQSALAVVRRAHSSASVEWRDRGKELTGVQFGSQDHRVLFYSKQAEIESRIKQLLQRHDLHDRGTIEQRRALSEQARGVVRVEVVLRGAQEIQKLFGLTAGMLPTLRLMAMPSVGTYVVSQDLRRLRLDRMGAPLTDQHDEHGYDSLLADIASRAQAFNEDQGERDSRRKHLSRTRQLVMFGYCVALSEVGRTRIVEVLGGGDSTLYDLERDMKAIGMPAMGTTSSEPHHRLQTFVEAIREQIPDFDVHLPSLGDEPVASGWITEAPWISRATDFEGNGMVVEDYDGISCAGIADLSYSESAR